MEARRAVDVVEEVLLGECLALDEHRKWIAEHWRAGLRRGHFVQWMTILERMSPDDSPEFQVAYGVSLRRTGRWETAEQIIQQSVQESGRRGDFPTQSCALLEWAILARLQGSYAKAIALLEQAERCNIFHDKELHRGIQIEQSQIALDQGDGARALQFVGDVGAKSLDISILTSEAFLLLGDYTDCRVTALQAMRDATQDRRTEASLHTLIGRSYEAGEQYDSAWLYFALALTVLEETEDISAIARAQANLAAVLLKLGKAQQAHELLERAKPVLSMLGDKVGHYVTVHNERLTNIHFAR
jgi:tetratricopeptide (TPR) repeat protein